MYKYLDVEDMDREEALLLYKGKMYINGNHQFAFKDALADEGKGLGLDIDTEIDEIAKITHSLSEESKICTLDLYFDDNHEKYLISHFKDGLMLNIDFLKEYASNHEYKLGYFIDFNGYECAIL